MIETKTFVSVKTFLEAGNELEPNHTIYRSPDMHWLKGVFIKHTDPATLPSIVTVTGSFILVHCGALTIDWRVEDCYVLI